MRNRPLLPEAAIRLLLSRRVFKCGSELKGNPALVQRRLVKLFKKANFGGGTDRRRSVPAQTEIPKQLEVPGSDMMWSRFDAYSQPCTHITATAVPCHNTASFCLATPSTFCAMARPPLRNRYAKHGATAARAGSV